MVLAGSGTKIMAKKRCSSCDRQDDWNRLERTLHPVKDGCELCKAWEVILKHYDIFEEHPGAVLLVKKTS
jgi:hypothetical protein